MRIRGNQFPRAPCDTAYRFGGSKFRLRIKIVAPCDSFGNGGAAAPYAAIGLLADTRLPPLRGLCPRNAPLRGGASQRRATEDGRPYN